MSRVTETCCEMCGRDLPLTFHHLIPKKSHNKRYVKKRFDREDVLTRGIDLCRDCHKMVHRRIPHKELALHYNTKEKLLAHPELIRFAEWVQKQRKRAKH